MVIGPVDIEMNAIISSFTAALLALSLNESAYMSEIIRGGLLAIDRGQTEASTALGLTPAQTLRKIVLPQALRVIVPPIGNQTISMLKTTSLVSVVAAQDLLTRVQNIYARNFLIIELLIVASLWYLVLTSIASGLQYLIERRLSRALGEQPADLLGRRAHVVVGLTRAHHRDVRRVPVALPVHPHPPASSGGKVPRLAPAPRAPRPASRRSWYPVSGKPATRTGRRARTTVRTAGGRGLSCGES